MRDSDIPDDAFTTEKMEEANLVMGPQSSLSTAWRVNEHLQELAYTQLWWVLGDCIHSAVGCVAKSPIAWQLAMLMLECLDVLIKRLQYTFHLERCGSVRDFHTCWQLVGLLPAGCWLVRVTWMRCHLSIIIIN